MKQMYLKTMLALTAAVLVSQPGLEVHAQEPGTDMVYTVQKNDSLAKIAKAIYGDAGAWDVIYEANRDQIKDPAVIYENQQFVLPYTSILTGAAPEAAPAVQQADEAVPDGQQAAVEAPAAPEAAEAVPVAEEAATAEEAAVLPEGFTNPITLKGTRMVTTDTIESIRYCKAYSSGAPGQLKENDYRGYILVNGKLVWVGVDVQSDPFYAQTALSYKENTATQLMGLQDFTVSFTSIEDGGAAKEGSYGVDYILRGAVILNVAY